MTRGNNRITMRSPGKNPILMVSQKPEISNQTNDSDSMQRIFASEDVWTEEHTVGHTVTLYNFHDEMFSMLCFVCWCGLLQVDAQAKGRCEGMGR